MKISEMAREASRGVFWLIDGEIFAFPYSSNDNTFRVAKSGLTYNHKRLWNDIKGKHNVPYNYYPRGRVDFTNRGQPIIYMNPNISLDYVPEIKMEFGLREEPKIQYDNSEHYKCYLDDGWKADKTV